MSSPLPKVILLDRDNTLNADPGYLSDPDKVALLPHVVAGLRLLAAAGYRFFVVSNQSGVGRGMMTEKDVEAVNARLAQLLAAEGIHIEKFYFCPHAPDEGCDCRKPLSGLVDRFIAEFGQPERAVIMGDRRRDLEAGASRRIEGILIPLDDDEEGASNQVYKAADMTDAARFVLEIDFERQWQSAAFASRDADGLAEKLAAARAAGKRIVFTNGCFDILHAGHLQYLWQARQLGDLLVLGLNSDDSVRRLKGDSRPVNKFADRMLVLANLPFIDIVVGFSEDNPIATLSHLKPDIHVKGGDYVREELPEYETVRNYGGEVVILPFRKGYSTTSLIDKLQR